MKDKYDKYHGHVTKKKVRHRERLCYCCRQIEHLAKDCTRNKMMNTSNLRMTGTSKWAVWILSLVNELCEFDAYIICDDGTIKIVKALLSDIMEKDCKALHYVKSLTEIVRP